MASVQVSLDEEPILRAFARVEAAGRNTRNLWNDVSEALQLSHRFRFDLGIAPDGTAWEGLDPEYAARKPRRADQILVLDAVLRDTLAGNVSGDGLDFGSPMIYSATHQFGDPERGIPARPFLGLSDDDDSEILRLAAEHLEDALP